MLRQLSQKLEQRKTLSEATSLQLPRFAHAGQAPFLDERAALAREIEAEGVSAPINCAQVCCRPCRLAALGPGSVHLPQNECAQAMLRSPPVPGVL